jgi:hypothetical protein
MVIYQRICEDLMVSTDPNTYIADSSLVSDELEDKDSDKQCET